MSLSQEILQAEAHDLAGRHQEAIKVLVSAVHKNQVEALARLGKRLLIGDRAPHLPREGANFLKEAAFKGSPEAPAILSVLHALGLYMQPGWREALECLALAASRGWVPAQQQLQILAECSTATAAACNDAAGWFALSRSVDVERWITPPAGLDLSNSPLIRSYPDFTTAAVCDWLIARSVNRRQRALVYDAVSRQVAANQTRTNSSVFFNLIETDLVNVLMQARMAACTGLPITHLEAATVLHYETGQQISEHYDFIDPNVPDHDEQIRQAGQRVITFLVYLNDEYQGGETDFPRLGISHKGTRGEGIFFVNAGSDGRADIRTLHAGRPPLQGEKWIVSQFMRNRKFL